MSQYAVRCVYCKSAGGYHYGTYGMFIINGYSCCGSCINKNNIDTVSTETLLAEIVKLKETVIKLEKKLHKKRHHRHHKKVVTEPQTPIRVVYVDKANDVGFTDEVSYSF